MFIGSITPHTLHFVLCRFDIRRAYRPTFLQKMKDIFGVGGHVYGYGAYFAAHALYSHWWNTRVWAPQSAAKSVYTVVVLKIVVHSVFSAGVEDDIELISCPSCTDKPQVASRSTSSSSHTFSRAIAETTAANGLATCRYAAESDEILHTFFFKLGLCFCRTVILICRCMP